jgi:hypothetical protein
LREGWYGSTVDWMAKEGEEWVGSEEAIAPQQPKLSLCQKPLEEGVLSSSLSSATLVLPFLPIRIINQKHTHILEEEQLCLSHEEVRKRVSLAKRVNIYTRQETSLMKLKLNPSSSCNLTKLFSDSMYSKLKRHPN